MDNYLFKLPDIDCNIEMIKMQPLNVDEEGDNLYCPVCRRKLQRNRRNNYCPRCGQRIRWE